MTRQELVTYAETYGWVLIFSDDHTDAFSRIHEGHPLYLYVTTIGGKIEDEDCWLIAPFEGAMLCMESGPTGAEDMLKWWMEGNTGDVDDWYATLDEDSRKLVNG